jgi:hypothetical protein
LALEDTYNVTIKATKTNSPTGKNTPNRISPIEPLKTIMYTEAIIATDIQQLTTAAVLNSIKVSSTYKYAVANYLFVDLGFELIIQRRLLRFSSCSTVRANQCGFWHCGLAVFAVY